MLAQLLFAVLWVPTAAAVGPCDAAATLAPRHPRAFAVGDSVMLGAAPALARAGFRVNARGCRQMAAGLALLRARERLPRIVVVALGTNGAVTRADLARLLRIAGPKRRVMLVTPSGPNAGDARLMRRAARRRPGRFCVADWRRRWRPAYTGADQLHLTVPGIRAFTRLLKAHRRGACGG